MAGRSQREVRRLTGISATYVGDMLWGVVPSFRVLERFAQGLELDADTLRELFEAAGYAAPMIAQATTIDGDRAIDVLAEEGERVNDLKYEAILDEMAAKGLLGKSSQDPRFRAAVKAVLARRAAQRGQE